MHKRSVGLRGSHLLLRILPGLRLRLWQASSEDCLSCHRRSQTSGRRKSNRPRPLSAEDLLYTIYNCFIYFILFYCKIGNYNWCCFQYIHCLYFFFNCTYAESDVLAYYVHIKNILTQLCPRSEETNFLILFLCFLIMFETSNKFTYVELTTLRHMSQIPQGVVVR